jgi:hypothetical protein
MERTKSKAVVAIETQVEAETRKTWKKVGGGSSYLSLDGRIRIIKPGEHFMAYEHEIPQSFRDTIICTSKEGITKPIIKNVVTAYKKVKGDEEGLFNIVNGNGKLMNEKPLTEEVAEQFLTSLTS